MCCDWCSHHPPIAGRSHRACYFSRDGKVRQDDWRLLKQGAFDENVSIALALSCCCTTTFAAEKTARVSAPDASGPLAFAAGEIKSALKTAGWDITPSGPAAFDIILEAPSGADKLDGKPESFKIDVAEDAGITKVRIRGADVRGAMYGGLDVAEQIRMNGPLSIKAKSEAPYLAVRAMKFNPPLKGNVYMSDEDLKNSAWFYDLEYWDRFMRTMAYDRYNALTFWSSHPYDQMVRLKKYPEATTLSQDQLDKNIVFFHKLFQMAKNYGLDTYIVTWNIHMSPGFRKAHKRSGRAGQPVDPRLSEGVHPGVAARVSGTDGHGNVPRREHADVGRGKRRVDSRRLPRYARKDRPEDAVHLPVLGSAAEGDGRDARQGELSRARYCWTSSSTASTCTRPTKPHPEEMRLAHADAAALQAPLAPAQRLHFPTPLGRSRVRGQDARPIAAGRIPPDSSWARRSKSPAPIATIRPQTVAHRDWKYEFEKNWMRFAVWGRMGYDPKLSDDYWIDRFSERFGAAAGKDAFLALKILEQDHSHHHFVPLELHERRLVSRGQYRKLEHLGRHEEAELPRRRDIPRYPRVDVQQRDRRLDDEHPRLRGDLRRERREGPGRRPDASASGRDAR